MLTRWFSHSWDNFHTWVAPLLDVVINNVVGTPSFWERSVSHYNQRSALSPRYALRRIHTIVQLFTCGWQLTATITSSSPLHIHLSPSFSSSLFRSHFLAGYLNYEVQLIQATAITSILLPSAPESACTSAIHWLFIETALSCGCHSSHTSHATLVRKLSFYVSWV